ncbi:MAG TPA: hypothetical protein VKA85_06145 [Candidatus Limnocylindrales bacterium]|nr:hypothetical protein [Candidatus Limnocylindrales bacterium]
MSDYRDRDTVVVREDRGSGLGTILGILLVVALLAAVWWFTLGPGAGTLNNGTTNNGGGTTNAQPTLQAPAASQPAAS